MLRLQNACFFVLSSLLESGNEVLVTTKPNFSTIEKIVSRFHAYKERMQFRFTITSLEDGLLKFWEPNAPLFQERIDSLKFAFNGNLRDHAYYCLQWRLCQFPRSSIGVIHAADAPPQRDENISLRSFAPP